MSHFAFDGFDWAGGMARELRKTSASLHGDFDWDWDDVRGGGAFGGGSDDSNDDVIGGGLFGGGNDASELHDVDFL